MKVTIELAGPDGRTQFTETFYDLPSADLIPDRALAIAREVSKLMVAYPAYSVIDISIEKDDDGTQNLQEPPAG